MKKGFTLLELLIVISIIGILITVGVASYSNAQVKSRNSRRMSDLKALQNAFEQYFAMNGQYPESNTVPACQAQLAATTQYLPAGLPTDPKPTYVYTYNCDENGLTYAVAALLENTTTGGNSPSADCSAYGTPGAYFCVKNLQ